MEKVQKLYRHPLYQECLEKNKKAEETRIFCKHGMEHFMDVARIAYILSVDRAYAISKEIIYVAALLHDIGKWKQYEDGTPHEKASADLAEQILEASGFSEEDQAQVLDAILKHRKRENGKRKILLRSFCTMQINCRELVMRAERGSYVIGAKKRKIITLSGR